MSVTIHTGDCLDILRGMAADSVRAVLERVQIRKAAYGSYPWHAVDPVSGWPVALPPEQDETIELHGKRYNAFRDMVWPKCFQRKREVTAALARYRALLEEMDDATG